MTDPPYEFCMGGNGNSDIAKRKLSQKEAIYSLDTETTKHSGVANRIDKLGREIHVLDSNITKSNGYTSGGGCFGTKNRSYHSEINETDVTIARKKYLEYLEEHGKDEESERLRVIANAIDNRKNTAFISNGVSNEILEQFCRVMKKINIYIWCNKNQLHQYLDFFVKKGCFIDLLTWHKTNPIPTCNNTYLSDTEYCVFAREKGVGVYGNYDTKRKYYVTEINVKDKSEYKHPTIKPIEIIKNLIINSSNEGDLVLDTFVGSGTTCVAAKELNRNYLGFELNPEYYEIAKDRINGISVKDRKRKEIGIMTIDDFLEE